MSLKDIKNLRTTSITSFDATLTAADLRQLIRAHYQLPTTAKITMVVRDTFGQVQDFDSGHIEVEVEGEGINAIRLEKGNAQVDMSQYRIGESTPLMKLNYVEISPGDLINKIVTAATVVYEEWKKSGCKPDTDMMGQRDLYNAVDEMQIHLKKGK